MPPKLPSRILPLLLHKLPQMPPASLARTAWALARFGCRPSAEWWDTFMKEVAGRMSCFEARSVYSVRVCAVGCTRGHLGSVVAADLPNCFR